MNIRERLEAFWAGERPDVIPFTIYQWEWRHTEHDPAWQNLFDKGMGVTWHLATTKDSWGDNVELREETVQKDGKALRRRSIVTPVGEVYELFEDDWRQKFFLETAQDYTVMTYVAKQIQVEPAYEEYGAKVAELPPYCVPLTLTGRTPNQTVLVDLVGLENYAFHLFDLEAEMMELYTALLANYRRRAELVAGGPGRFVSVLENFTAETLGPKRYAQLLSPVYDECFPWLQQAGKIVGTHYDGQLSAVKDLVAEAPMDLIESVTPPPEGDMTLAECRKAWPDKLLWSNLNVGLYELPAGRLREAVLSRVEEAAPNGRGLAFEVSEHYPRNWKESLPVVLDALEETRR